MSYLLRSNINGGSHVYYIMLDRYRYKDDILRELIMNKCKDLRKLDSVILLSENGRGRLFFEITISESEATYFEDISDAQKALDMLRVFDLTTGFDAVEVTPSTSAPQSTSVDVPDKIHVGGDES